MQPAKYDSRMVQAAQNRQQNSLNGSRKYFPNTMNRPSTTQPSSSMYTDESYNEGTSERYWEDGGGQQPGADKPTGLRHFSTKVCEKVKEKGLTNYNEVADELVTDYFQNNVMKHIDVVKQEYDMKNIRRRVYDALNVLLAMNIITKNKKDIRWIGLPASASQEITRLEEEKTRRETSIKNKMEALQDMIMQIVAYKNLVDKNRKHEHEHGRPDRDSVLHLPFLIINTDKEANVECSVSCDKSEFLFSFDKRFEIHDDFEVLKKMKMACGLDTGTSSEEDLKKAKEFLPELHQHYIDEIIEGHKRAQQEKEERRKQALNAELSLSHYFEPHAQTVPQMPQMPQSRYNRHLQEHLMNDGSEDNSAVAGITEKDHAGEDKDPGPINRVPMFNYSPQKIRQMPNTSGMPQMAPSATATTRRYYVQKTPQGTIKHEMSPAIRTMTRPYPTPTMSGERRMAAGSGTVAAPIKYYVQQGQHPMQYPQSSQRYRVRPPPQNQVGQSQQPQRVAYTQSNQMPPGSQRIISQRVVGPGGPHPPGTIIRKVVRKVVMNSPAGQKPSPAQQVIQKKRLEQQDIHHEMKQEQPMTSAQAAAALIQHPHQDDYNYY